jgi:hypothetical protein
VRDRYINGNTIIIPMSLYFIVALFYHHAEKDPVKPRKVISPITARTKRITPRFIKSSTVMFPSLIRGAKNWHLLCQTLDETPTPLLKLNITIAAI